MIAAVATVLNEADILQYTLEHLLLEGVDQIYLAHGPSTDQTEPMLIDRIAAGFPLTVVYDFEPCHKQPYWIQTLADLAGEDGAEWIIPFDADEFWYAVDGNSIAATLKSLPASVGKVDVPMIRHFDWDYRMELATLPKVAYRYAPGVTVANGNHGCSAGGTHVMGHLALREICYRGFGHFVRKTRERNALIDPALAGGEGAHQRQYAGMSVEQLQEAWDAYCAIPRLRDPIPSQLKAHP